MISRMAVGAYAAGVGLVVLVQAAIRENPTWIVIVLALVAPVGPVLVGYVLTRRKLKEQEKAVEEVHVLVNSRLSKTLDALSGALVDNIRLKERFDLPISEEERVAANEPERRVLETDVLEDNPKGGVE